MLKVIWHTPASPPYTDGLIVFARWRQCAPPTRLSSPSGVSIVSAVLAGLTAVTPTFLPSELPFCLGGSGPHLIHVSLVPQHKQHLDLFSRFCWAHYHDSETNRQTTLYSASVASRLHLRSTAIWANTIRANVIIIIPQFLGTSHALFEHFAFMPTSVIIPQWRFLAGIQLPNWSALSRQDPQFEKKNNLFMTLLDIWSASLSMVTPTERHH